MSVVKPARRFGPALLVLGLAVMATAGAAAPRSVPEAAAPKLGGPYERHSREHAFVYAMMEGLNRRSVALDREFCGFVYYDASGTLRATRARKGGTHSCMPELPAPGARVFASYHTHAAFARGSLNEYPSDQDLRGDFANRQNGYVATPGGRLWFVDHRKRVARQLCGYRCLPHDRRYREDAGARPKKAVNLPNLMKIIESRFGGAGDGMEE